MIKKYLRKVISLVTVIISVLALNSIGASAEWKQDNNGLWYTDGDSWYMGWKQINGKWYYFNTNGYMAHDTTIDGYNIGSDGTWIQNNTSNLATPQSSTLTQENHSDSFDINVSLKYNIYLDDKVKGINPNIIKATRQAIFDAGCSRAKLKHYNGYSVNDDVLIWGVKEATDTAWEVDYRVKNSNEKEYDTISYSVVTVTKQKDGSYVGEISGSSPAMPIGETY